MKPEAGAPETGRADPEIMKQEFRKVLGKEWVSDDLAIISCYSGAFTGLNGSKPEMIVFPSTGKELQAVRCIAERYRIPLFSMTKVFDHTQKDFSGYGGVLIDFRRMDIVGG